MSNPFQISEDAADLSFGDEDFLLESIDLEAIAAKALQTQPSRAGISRPFQSVNAQQADVEDQISTQFQAQAEKHSNTTNHRTITRTLSTPQSTTKKFTFKPRKSPENGQVSNSRRVLTPSETTQKYPSSGGTQSTSPDIANVVKAVPTIDRAISQARIPGGTTPNVSHGLRTPNAQTQAAQPPIAVTVKRDGTSFAKVGQVALDPKGGQELAFVNSNRPPVQADLATKSSKVFQKYVPHAAERTTKTNNQTEMTGGTTSNMSCGLRTPNFQTQTSLAVTTKSTYSNPVSNVSSQLRNPSESYFTNPSKSNTVSLNQGGSRSLPGGSISSQNSLRTNFTSLPSNQSQPRRHSNTMGPSSTQSKQNSSGNSQVNSISAYNTPRPSTQFQSRKVSPMQANTPGYRTPSGRPSPGSNGSNGGTTPLSQPGQSPRYPATPRTGGSHFSTCGTSGVRENGNRHGNTPQVPLLTPRVAQLCQTPSGSGNRTTIRTRARKFPGPAGVLPKLLPGQKLDAALVEDLPTEKIEKPASSADDSINIPCTQDLGVDEFQRGAWLTMKTELGDSAKPILSSYNIAVVLRKASLKQLPRKQVPNLCVMIRSVTHNGNDACVLLKDPSGEMQGTVHRKIVEDYQSDLKPGSVMVLRKVGVLSPSIRNHYLNITPSNLVQVYPAESCSTSCSQASPKSQGTHSRINRSPESASQSELMKEPQHSLQNRNAENMTSPTSRPSQRQGNSPGNCDLPNIAGNVGIGVLPQTKTLQIEGVNTPERFHRAPLLSKQQSSHGGGCPDLVKRRQQTKTLIESGIPAVQVSQKKESLSNSGDSGFNLDQSIGEFNQGEVTKSHALPAGETKCHEEKQNGQIDANANNSLTWLRKRHAVHEDRLTNISRDGSDAELSSSSKRLCLEASQATLGTPVTSSEQGAKHEENFDSLLEGIEHEFFDDF